MAALRGDRRSLADAGEHLVWRSSLTKGISMAKVSMLARLVVHDGKGDELIAAFGPLIAESELVLGSPVRAKGVAV